MKTLTNSPLYISLNAEEMKQLASLPVNETADIVKQATPVKTITAATMWKIHQQRRGISLRRSLR